MASMATTRKKSPSGFSLKEDTVDDIALPSAEETVEEQLIPVVFDEVIPEPDPEPEVEPAPVVVAPKPPVAAVRPIVLNPPPKRHPRNIPKFSNRK